MERIRCDRCGCYYPPPGRGEMTSGYVLHVTKYKPFPELEIKKDYCPACYKIIAEAIKTTEESYVRR